MNRKLLNNVGTWAGYLIIPLFIASAISLLTFRQFSPLVIGALILMAVCIILYTVTNPTTVAEIFRARAIRTIITTTIVAVAVVGIVVLFNILATRVTVRYDATENKVNTLADSSVKAAQKLSAPVQAVIFYSTNTTSSRDSATDLLNRYKAYTDKINVESYDIQSLTGVSKISEFGVKTDPVVVFKQGNKRQDATSVDEQSFTRAFVKLEQQVQKRVLFVTGHGERGKQGMAQAATALTDNNYTVDTYNPTTRTGGDNKPLTLNVATDILIFSGPTTPYKQEELDAFVKFLRQGGKAMFLYDPSSLQQTNASDNMNDMLKNWNGLQFSKGWLLELDPSLSSPNSPILLLPDLSTSSSEVAKGINYQVQFPLAGAVDKGQNTTGFTPIFSSSDNSWLKTDPNDIKQQKYNFDATKDKRGPQVVAATFETDAKETPDAASLVTPTPAPGTTPAPAATPSGKTRLVLFAGIEFAADNQQSGLSLTYGNYNLFVNSVNWLAEDPNAVVIEQKQTTTVPFTVSKAQDTFIYYSSVFGLPIVVLILGLVIWWRRR